MAGDCRGFILSDFLKQANRVVEDYYQATIAQDWDAWQATLHPDVQFTTLFGIGDMPTRLYLQKLAIDRSGQLVYEIVSACLVPGVGNVATVMVEMSYNFSPDPARQDIRSYIAEIGVVSTDNGVKIYSHHATGIADSFQQETLWSKVTDAHFREKIAQAIPSSVVSGTTRFCEVVTSVTRGSNGTIHLYLYHAGQRIWVTAKNGIANGIRAGDSVEVTCILRWNKSSNVWYYQATAIRNNSRQ